MKQSFHDVVAAAFLCGPPGIPVYLFKHELPQAVHGGLHPVTHVQVLAFLAVLYHIPNHGINPLSVAVAQHLQAVHGQLKGA